MSVIQQTQSSDNNETPHSENIQLSKEASSSHGHKTCLVIDQDKTNQQRGKAQGGNGSAGSNTATVAVADTPQFECIQLSKEVIASQGNKIRLVDTDPDNKLDLYCYVRCMDSSNQHCKIMQRNYYC